MMKSVKDRTTENTEKGDRVDSSLRWNDRTPEPAGAPTRETLTRSLHPETQSDWNDNDIQSCQDEYPDGKTAGCVKKSPQHIRCQKSADLGKTHKYAIS